MIVGGIVAAPFTLGASIGLTTAGTVVTIAGGATTKVADLALGGRDLKTTNKMHMVDDFLGHYKSAKRAFAAVSEVCEELTILFPTIGSEDSVLTEIASAARFAIDRVYVPAAECPSSLYY